MRPSAAAIARAAQHSTEGSIMDTPAAVVTHLFASLNRHDYKAMADCYHPDATFHDIAFDLHGKRQIAAMWQLVCAGDIRAAAELTRVDSAGAVAHVVDNYTFSDTGRHVRNVIESRFTFRDGLIAAQVDECDPKAWGAMALGGLQGVIAGRSRYLRNRKAMAKLKKYLVD
jgi:ketosteroid isomerase-like protein